MHIDNIEEVESLIRRRKLLLNLGANKTRSLQIKSTPFEGYECYASFELPNTASAKQKAAEPTFDQQLASEMLKNVRGLIHIHILKIEQRLAELGINT